ncbi:hypothetical protein [Streptomyces sp. NPDC056883]|uniref:hypothetical protein n=1 Tax=Streptomyces sp. NPDC056883 TaxID=3345959 RepID=UPI003681822C
MSPAAIPRQILRQLTPVLRTMAPLLDTSALDQGGGLSTRLTSRATAEAVRRSINEANAVYIAWDVRCRCRYVGSVDRQERTAVGARLAEHHKHPTEGRERQAEWALLTVLPIRSDATPQIVRAAEGWAARLLSPQDGNAHPCIDLAAPPAALAASMGT